MHVHTPASFLYAQVLLSKFCAARVQLPVGSPDVSPTGQSIARILQLSASHGWPYYAVSGAWQF